MIIYLMRHGEAERPGPGGTDAGRRLTGQGVKDVRATARLLKRGAVTFDRILTSPLRRAEETAGIMAETVGSAATPMPEPRLATSGGPDEIIDLMLEHADAESLLVVGHMPSIGEAAIHLCAGGHLDMAFFPGTLLALEPTRLRPRLLCRLLWVLPATEAGKWSAGK